VPELPEVQALVDFLAERTDGLAVASVELASFSVLKTFDPPPTALAGGMVDGWSRHGKFLDLNVDASTWCSTWPARAGCAGRRRCPTP